jgi:hypothetical protein
MTSASRSIAFDERRAESYDRTRSLSPETMTQLPGLLCAELREKARGVSDSLARARRPCRNN